MKTPAGHTLAGTLTLPKGASRTKPVSAIVTVTGSGAQDRDENIGLPGFRPFRQLADSLGRRGIAVLRMDDRGTGSSGGTFKGSTSADFAEDVRAGLAYLRTRPEIRADRLGVLGHSEGALIAPMVAEKEPTLRAIVLLAGLVLDEQRPPAVVLGTGINVAQEELPVDTATSVRRATGRETAGAQGNRECDHCKSFIPVDASVWEDETSRRSFLKVMGASLAVLAGCRPPTVRPAPPSSLSLCCSFRASSS